MSATASQVNGTPLNGNARPQLRMSRREWTLLVAGLVLIVGTALGLLYLRTNQRLGKPGVKASPIANSGRMKIELPLNLPGYAGKDHPVDPKTLEALPADTSMVQATYQELAQPGLPEIQTFVVMMGADRTSIHKPQYCLTGAGWSLDDKQSELTAVRLERPAAVELPVMKLIARRQFEVNGQATEFSGVFVYWFVADQAVTARHEDRVWWMARHLLQTGELQRWAYVAYFAPCVPGTEAETFERMKKLIRAAVPEYQLAWPQ